MIKALLLLFGAGKFGKVLLSGGSMLLSLVIYGQLFGWRYAAGFILLLFIHEMGHFLAAKQRGLEVGLPTFIPFVGAWINLKEQPRDVETEAYVGFAGPLLGSVAALGCYYMGRHTGEDIWLALAYIGFLLNLFNLIPLSPLDGGRIVAIISPKIWLIGFPLLVAFFIYRPNPLLLLIALIAAPQLWSVLKGEHQQSLPEGYYQVPLEQRLQYGCYYLALLAFLAAMSHDVHLMLGHLQH